MNEQSRLSLTLLVQIASEWEQYVLGLGAYRCQNHGSPLRITIDYQVWLRAGHPLEMLHMGAESTSLEDVLDPIAWDYDGDAPYPLDAIHLAKAVRAAQLTSTSTRLTPWQKYCLVPPKELLRLRSLVARGRAREKVRTRTKTPREIELLFAPSFPNELFWKVLAFWNPRH